MRSLFIALVVVAIGFLSLAQFSGEWELNMSVFPTLSMESTYLTLMYSFTGWNVSSISYFSSTGFETQRFHLVGSLGPLLVEGNILFNPVDDSTVVVFLPGECTIQTLSHTLAPPEYQRSWIKLTLTLGGAEFSATIYHWAFPYYMVEAQYQWPCCIAQTASATFMRYVFCVRAGPFSAVANFEDCCTGITFEDLAICFDDLSPCCGLGFDMEFYFTKDGFQHLRLGVENFPICCGISFDASVKFTEAAKEVIFTPKWVGFGEFCYEIYGNVRFDNGIITGVDIYGFRFRCVFSECNWLEYVEAFDVPHMEEVLKGSFNGEEAETICEGMCEEESFEEETSDYIFQDNENEYLKLHFCGPSCCDGQYTVEVTIFFQPTGHLFGMSRAELDLEIPVLSNMIFLNKFSVTTSGTTELEVGWRISF